MRYKFLLAAVSVLIIPLGVWAGKEVGNGGSGVICRDPDTGLIHRAELLDLYEAREIRGLELDLGSPTEAYQVKLKRVLKTLRVAAPIRSQVYEKYVDRFWSEGVLLRDSEFVVIPDSFHISVPKPCKIEQVAIQKAQEFPGDKRYFISQELWQAFDENSKAALVLHEIIYREALDWGHKDSKGTRFLVSQITSTKRTEFSRDSLNEVYLAAGFDAVEKYGTLGKESEWNQSLALFDTVSLDFYRGLLPVGLKMKFFTFDEQFRLKIDRKSGQWVEVHGLVAYVKGSVKIEAKAKTFNAELGESEEILVLSNFGGKAFADFGQWQMRMESCTKLIFRPQTGTPRTAICRSFQTVIPNLDYQSLALYSEGWSQSEENIDSQGVVLGAYLLSTQEFVLKSPQGPKRFCGPNQYIGTIRFDGQGLVLRSWACLGESFQTESGPVVLTGRKFVSFNKEGLAIIRDFE